MSTDERLASLIDRLVERRQCFALYRLPWQEELHLVLQREACPTILHSVEELSGRRGFVHRVPAPGRRGGREREGKMPAPGVSPAARGEAGGGGRRR